ncbi:heavy-metal-associated domain-containing protein [Caenimonas sedimenti]|uniref:Heavy-metal-associated domain-containing protein n=1 Tax=Caenimonas sedimenti TaxID=2596921 RepID=A0A562ZXX6_9BURK|nr:heavy-metal-associated domain-containing protein [Caenimonas sedimenti]TWO73004.1 heavy-metal-associated domain-containing protein [Caenimonas sedimenti]
MHELNVPNMNCGGCAKSVARAISAVDPAAKVEFDLREKKVMIESESGRERFDAALAAAWFKPA